MTASAILVTTAVTFLGRVAHGFYSPRVLETAEMVLGVIGLLTWLVLRQDFSGLDVIGQGFESAREVAVPADRGTFESQEEEQS